MLCSSVDHRNKFHCPASNPNNCRLQHPFLCYPGNSGSMSSIFYVLLSLCPVPCTVHDPAGISSPKIAQVSYSSYELFNSNKAVGATAQFRKGLINTFNWTQCQQTVPNLTDTRFKETWHLITQRRSLQRQIF